MSILSIDGVDLSTLNALVDDSPDARHGLAMDYATGIVPGREGAVHLSLRGQARTRQLTIAGAVNPSSHSTLLANLDSLKTRITGRQVEIVWNDQTTRSIRGRLQSAIHAPIPPQQTQRAIFLQWVFLCADPYAYDVTSQSIDFTAGATQCPLGSGRARPILTAVGPVTDWGAILRDSGGTEVQRIETTGIVASGITLLIDCDRQIITLDGVNSPELLTGGDFLILDPADGVEGGAQPTLEQTAAAASAVASYSRTWS